MAGPVPVHEVIERLGFGWAQYKTLVLGGGVWLADGAELLLIGSVTRALSADWDLKASQRGLIVSIVFFGVLLGNALSGTLGDRYGRRVPICLSYLLIVIFSLLSAFSWDVWSMTVARMFVGISFGVGQPSWNALGTELAPTAWRIMMNGLGQTLFVVGELYSAWLIFMDDPDMKDLDWRVLLALGCVPSGILGVFAYLYLYESPSYLAATGRTVDAKKELEKMRDANGMPGVSCDIVVPRVTTTEALPWSKHLSVIFGPRLLFSTLTTCLSTFTMNFIFYGGLYAFPQVLPELDLRLSPAANLIIGATMEIPGFLGGILIGQAISRKAATLFYLVSSTLSILIFLHGVGHFGAGPDETFIMLGFFGIKCFVNTGFLVVYLYSSEIYPTMVRNTGSAVCIAAGRIGWMVCPLVYEHLTEHTGDFRAFFVFISGLCVVNLLFVAFLSIETAGKKLEDDHEDEPLIAPK